MTYVFHRHTKANYPIAVAGDGPYVIDSTGKRYLDASGGAAVSCLGLRPAMPATIIGAAASCNFWWNSLNFSSLY